MISFSPLTFLIVSLIFFQKSINFLKPLLMTTLDHSTLHLYLNIILSHNSTSPMQTSLFHFEKKKKYLPANTNITDEVDNALPKLKPQSSSTASSPSTLDKSHVPPTTFIQPPTSSNVLQTVNLNVFINFFSCLSH